jgi:hypothetical protein
MTPSKTGRLALLWSRDAPKWRAPTSEDYRLNRIFEALAALGIEAEAAIYADDVADHVRERLLGRVGVLVWVDPLFAGRNRSTLDALLRILWLWNDPYRKTNRQEGRIRTIPARMPTEGKTICKGRHIPAATSDEIVLINLKQHVLAPDSITVLLKSLMERQTAKSESADLKLLTLQRELSDADDRLRRLYYSIEDGIVEIDNILRERTVTLKSDRERAKAALNRARAQCGTVTAVDAQKIDAFARLMTENLDNGDTNAQKDYLAQSSTRSKSTARPFGSSAAGMSSKPSLQVDRTRTEIFVVL